MAENLGLADNVATAVFSNSGKFYNHLWTLLGAIFASKGLAMTIFSSPFQPDDCKQFKTDEEFEQLNEVFLNNHMSF